MATASESVERNNALQLEVAVDVGVDDPGNPRPGYGMRMPEMLRAITRRWISEVPSKIV